MKYLCLVYLESEKLHAVPDTECKAYSDTLRGNVLVAAEALQPVETATTVRLRNGKVSVTDGPFAETKEVIAGFALLEAGSKAEAIRLTREFLKIAGDGECELRQIFTASDGADDCSGVHAEMSTSS